MIVDFKGKRPSIAENVFIAPNAVIIGDVTIQEGASIWYGTVLRGDVGAIFVGSRSNIQDNCTVHADHGIRAVIGERVTVGHNAVIHGCVIEEECLIGINAVVLTGARILRRSVVAAGSVVMEGQTVGPLQMVAGTPARRKKTMTEEESRWLLDPAQDYIDLMKHYV